MAIDKEINARLEQIEADVYAMRIFVTQLAALNPLGHLTLEQLPELVRISLMHLPVTEVRLELAVRSAGSMCQSLRELRLGMAQEDVEYFSQKPSES